MADEHLLVALRQIKTIVDEALAGKMPKAPNSSQESPRPESLPDHILALKENEFFAQPKTYHEVHTELVPIYLCDADRVKVACLRLQRRKELRKTSKLVEGKNQVAYVW